jgi:cholesterol transport system auxiliary component
VALASWRIACLVTICLLCGCVSRPYLEVRSFAFTAPPASKLDPGFQTHRVVAIRSLRVAAPFDRRSLVYRMGEYAFESDPYAEFFVPASEGLLLPIRSYLRQAGAFEAVVEPGSALKPNTVAEFSVLDLYGDFRKSQQGAAILRLRVLLFDSPNGIPGKLVLEREYSRRIPLEVRTPDALMAGWNEALAQILAQLVSDVGGLEPAPVQ